MPAGVGPPPPPPGVTHPVTFTIVAGVLVCGEVWSESTVAVLDSSPQVVGAVALMVTTTSSGPLGEPLLAARVPMAQEMVFPAPTVQDPSEPEPGLMSKLALTPVSELARSSVTVTPVAWASPVFLTVIV
jgi:hypothetical protein